MKRLLFLITLCLFAQLPVAAQDKKSVDYSLPKQPKTPALWQWDDALLIGALVADEASTHYTLNNCASCEHSSLIRNQGARVAFKAGIFSLIKFVEWKNPRDRQKSKWVKVSVAGVFTFLAVRNYRQSTR